MGHTIRSPDLAKTILQGTVQGGQKRGRQRERWEDSIRGWTGMDVRETLSRGESRGEWRKLTAITLRRPNG
ncbi:hypothetical protein PoB_003252800 [Plakobranchus ocellatus]|uniref:Uncharacterized protein n=1 Tax=Plakobranchus ocellatus TaxID=259542 RepID=A0AAV4AFH4_9GAST|nr:hypothetical protein PoB_003252800 [Plakobranchus ocellatus]